MNHASQTYALVVPDGVVTYNLCGVFDERMQRTGTFPTDGLLHRVGSERSTPLDRHEVERYVADFGVGQRLQAAL